MNNKLGLTPIKPPQGGFIGVKMVNLVVPKKMKDILADALLLQITTLNSFNRLQRYANVTLIVQKTLLF
jgi:hypothetical protein